MKQKVLLVVLIMTLCISGIFAEKTFRFGGKPTRVLGYYDPHPFEWPTSTPEEQGLDSSVFENTYKEAKYMPFIYSVIAVRNGYLIAEQYFNGMTKNSANLIHSTSKSFISALVGIALKENYLDSVDQKMMDFFPEYITPNLDPRKFDITIWHLLTMSAGFDWDDNEAGWRELSGTPDWMKYTIELPLKDNPGGKFHYSTLQTHLLSGIITTVTGMSTRQFAETYLFEPLGISIRNWYQDPKGYFVGGSGMFFSPRDMARFGYLYLNNGLVDGKQIIPVQWVEDSLRYYFGGDLLSYGIVKNWGYGYQWDIGRMAGYDVYYRLGLGGQLIFNIPELNMIIVTTANGDSWSNSNEQIFSIYKLISYYILSPIRNLLGSPPYSPANLSGRTVKNRSLTQVEYINILKWQPSSRNKGVHISKYRIYQLQSGDLVLLGEVDAGRLEYWHRIRSFNEVFEKTYGISSVTVDNKESTAAIITIHE